MKDSISLINNSKIIHDNKDISSDTVYVLKTKKDPDNIFRKKEIEIIPSYKIKKVELISGKFDQGKISLVVDKNLEDKYLKSICKKIKKEHNQFTSIIICVYLNSEIGLDLAMELGKIILQLRYQIIG